MGGPLFRRHCCLPQLKWHLVHVWLGYVYFSPDYWKKMAKVLRSAGHHLIPVKENLVDKIWTDRPERPCKPLLALGLDYTGQNPAAPNRAPSPCSLPVTIVPIPVL